jgi:aryl-alcohol dehydrogenase-like predicted oxidoreductase
MIAGHATPEGTTRFAARFPRQQAASFYQWAQGLNVSGLGLGTYLGGVDDGTDRAYTEAVIAAARGGVNFLDTAINYRHQRSERSIGVALAQLTGAGEIRRDEVVVCTKAGFLVPHAVPKDVLRAEDVVGGMHSMAPEFLADQIERSRANLGLETIDVFYLHNPETQLGFVSRELFEERIGRAFASLEKLVAEGRIRYYGTATWEGFRKRPEAGESLSLTRLVALAREVGGGQHHLRFIQLPFNLAMVEAFVQKPETLDGKPTSVLEVADRYGVTVVASSTLAQAKLTRNLSEAIAKMLPGAASDAQRAIQFTRSTPGVSVALVGMSRASHVAENLGVSTLPLLDRDRYMRFYQTAG